MTTMQALWIGTLTRMERLSIESFLRHGHGFELYVYEPVGAVPDGVVVKDANEIVPRARYDYEKFSTLGAFSDFFRWKLLLDKGGWWTDLDSICLRPFDFPAEYVISSEATREGGQHTNCGNLKFPKGSELARRLWAATEEFAIESIPWAKAGPALIKRMVSDLGLEAYVHPPETFCPVPWWDTRSFVDPTRRLQLPAEAYAVHLWHSVWGRLNLAVDVLPRGSYYWRLAHPDAVCLDDVTACIKTFLRDASLFHCVKTLKAQYPEVRVIVGDDGRRSREKETKLTALGVDQYLRLPWNRGCTVGRNRMIDLVTTPYTLLLDDDFGFGPEAGLERLRALMAVADLAAGDVIQVGTKGWAKPGERLNFGGNLVRTPTRIYHVRSKGDYRRFDDIRYELIDVPLNFFVARTEVLRRVRWDETLRCHPEHEDFFMRAKAANVRVVHCPDAIARHQEMPDARHPEYDHHRTSHIESCLAIFRAKWGAGSATQVASEDECR